MAAESEFNIYQHFPSVSCFSRVFNWSCHLFSSVLPPGADTLRAEHLQISGWTSDLFCKHFKQITEIKDILGNFFDGKYEHIESWYVRGHVSIILNVKLHQPDLIF